MKQIGIIALILISFTLQAQVDTGSDLFRELEKQDSTFFERGFNQCDMGYLDAHVAEDLKFYHDQSGFQDRAAFFENTRNNICSNSAQKPIRQVDASSYLSQDIILTY